MLLGTKNISDKGCRENQYIYCKFSNIFSENHAVYYIMWRNMVEPGRP
jgi:hypothetical protein